MANGIAELLLLKEATGGLDQMQPPIPMMPPIPPQGMAPPMPPQGMPPQMPPQGMAPPQFASGGISSALEHARRQGRGGDTMLAHINPQEAALLKSLGGSGTVNPNTGLPEFRKFGWLGEKFDEVTSGADDFVNENIPGGWATVAAIAGTAMGLPPGLSEGSMATEAGGMAGAEGLVGSGGLSTGLTAGEGLTAAELAAATGEGAAAADTILANAADVVDATNLPLDTGATSGSAMDAFDASNVANTEGVNTTSLNDYYNTADAADAVATDTGTGLSYDPGEGYGTGTAGGMAGAEGLTGPGGLSTGLKTVGITDLLKSVGKLFGGDGKGGIGGGSLLMAALLPSLLKELNQKKEMAKISPYSGPLSKFKYDPSQFTPRTVTPTVYKPHYAAGGVTSLAVGGGINNQPTGPVEQMSQNVVGAGGMYPQSQMEHTNFATPTQMPTSAEIIGSDYDAETNPFTGAMMAAGGVAGFAPGGMASTGDIEDLISEAKTTTGGLAKLQGNALKDNPNALAALAKMKQLAMLKKQHELAMAQASKGIKGVGMAQGGPALREGSFVVPADVVSHLGNGSSEAGLAALHKRTGAKPIKGHGDGMSDSIPTTIDGRQPARVADGEAIIEPEQVKRIGRGSSNAGAKKLYDMMNKVRKARTGTSKQGRQINPGKYLPA